MKHIVVSATARLELSRIKGKDEYDWFTYKGKKAINVEFRGSPVSIGSGTKYGVRPSSNGKQVRLVLDYLGENRVITIDESVAKALSKSSPPFKKVKPKVTEQSASHGAKRPRVARNQKITPSQRWWSWCGTKFGWKRPGKDLDVSDVMRDPEFERMSDGEQDECILELFGEREWRT